MRRFETLFIVTPNSSEEELKAVAEKFRGVVTGMKGTVASYDEQGMKKLAYRVKKQNKGYYVLMDYFGQADIVAELERNLRLDERILKYLTVKLADQVDPSTVEVEESETGEEKAAAEVPVEEAQSTETQESEGAPSQEEVESQEEAQTQEEVESQEELESRETK